MTGMALHGIIECLEGGITLHFMVIYHTKAIS